MIEARLRTQISEDELAEKAGKIVTPDDFNLVLTGPAKLRKPDGGVLCVYLPGVLREALGNAYETLHELRTATTGNRGLASGTRRLQHGDQKRSYAKNVASAIIGAIDPGGIYKFCRLTAWTGQNLDAWTEMRPVFEQIAAHFREHVPERYAAQLAYVNATRPEWVIPGTPFTTVTVNNTYPTGVHQDAGDLEEGFSTLAVCRRGDYTGGLITFPRYRVGVDMRDGDLLLMDAHEFHGNTAIEKQSDDAERISVVSYYRTKMAKCGTPEAELAKAQSRADRRSKLEETR